MDPDSPPRRIMATKSNCYQDPPEKMGPHPTFEEPADQQAASPLFRIPTEIREKIYDEALSQYVDDTRLYDEDSFARPGYTGPHKLDTALLQTCQRIFSEARFRPWILNTHTFWVAWDHRQPPDTWSGVPYDYPFFLNDMYRIGGELPIDVQIFAQQCSMEGLKDILTLEKFFPRTLTITIRHTDWYEWEMDQRLWIGKRVGHGGLTTPIPASVRELRIELESLKRKKDQVEYVAGEMANKWWFQRTDGVVMMAQREGKVWEWEGSSTWEGERWVRDESKPGVVEYYNKTVTWRPSPETRVAELKEREDIHTPETFKKIEGGRRFLNAEELDRAGVPDGTPADEAIRMVRELWRAVRAGEVEFSDFDVDDIEDGDEGFTSDEDVGDS